MAPPRAPALVKAVLGPTNTGKTHLAIERMLAHRDGMIGLPLRLLAREVYDKVVKAKGAAAAALITGEEKIAPESARYFVCTVEAMPLDRRADFLAVDEIQLARDPDRGHVFSDRILHARGLGETMLLGSDAMRPILRRLLPKAEFSYRERLSTLAYAGHKKLTKLPKRTAIVAFSAEDVYAIAELIRRHRGGAAVVMGALSPRTRNAQVALYQSGEVDFLVATDAIGMGLNMDVDHVAFAAASKFDGRRNRVLRPDETAQIAGRAGRFRTDGTFGETGECPPFDEETIERVEAHEFEPVDALEWRNPHLDFDSVSSLLKALEAPPQQPGLLRARGADDEETLKRLMLDDELMDRARGERAVRRLWEACQIPDFRKSGLDEHAKLVARIAHHLLSPRARLPSDWIAREIDALDRSEGDLSVLQMRLAHVRTWSYAANRTDWLDDNAAFRDRAREIEDKLSDALHALLTQRFIDRRTSALLRGLKREDALLAGVSAEGEVTVEGHHVGRLDGLSFVPDPRALGLEARAVRNAAARALAPEVARRLQAIAQDPEEGFALHLDGRVHWRGAAIARIAPGSPLLAPKLTLSGAADAPEPLRRAARERLEAWLHARIARDLAPLVALQAAYESDILRGAGRGLAFRLLESAGALDRAACADLVDALSPDDRAALRATGVRIGRHTAFVAGLSRQKPGRLLSALWHWTQKEPHGAPFRPPRRALALPRDPDLSWETYAAAGLRPVGPFAIRIDAVERLAGAARAARGQAKDFPLTEALARIAGLSLSDAGIALKALGYRRVAAGEGDAPARWRPPYPRRPPRADQAGAPFAALAQMRTRP
ncbi:MAG: hypothetical protein GC189_08175 [Alphaproteobacteria bacterium]|nr:hypothetical protein [Alphaproteobacteria bacterium]